jgi:hypothetical protein
MPLHRHRDRNLVDPVRTVTHATPPAAGPKGQEAVKRIEEERKLAAGNVLENCGALCGCGRIGKPSVQIP